ncbi:hypothetical protein WA026_021453 [Henosepilachna vigintioctopunctata]|uniref:Uncharacterized protein n=1 Tax=Henosepilachna vigintioctopunctata TaxID=420089 RepID=A0AAW1TSA6_9CUCU
MTYVICLLVIFSLANIEEMYSLKPPNVQSSSAESIPCVLCETTNHSKHNELNLSENLHRISSAVSKADHRREEDKVSTSAERKGSQFFGYIPSDNILVVITTELI